MHSFRLRLILVLVACVTAVTVASTYFEVLAHKHFLREDLERRTNWLGEGLQPYLEQKLAGGDTTALPGLLSSFRTRMGVPGLAVVNSAGEFVAIAGDSEIFKK